MRNPIKWIFLFIVLNVLAILIGSNLFYNNSGESTSEGTPGNGSLSNAYKVDYKTRNSKYFSPVSYYLFSTGYVNSRLYSVLLASYKECETTCPGVYFRIMECSRKHGGKTLIHRSHRNGLSVDFMVPLIRKGRQIKLYDRFGLWHYLLNFDAAGRLKIDRKVNIDFETLGRQIVALDNACRANGLSISKVILKIDLKDDFFQTVSGKEVKQRGIYFAKNLPKAIDILHDDHYHIDFVTIRLQNP